jgi:hypothetical protein
VAKWTEAQFLEALRAQKRPDGTTIDSVMPAAFGQMNDVELKAIWAYINVLSAAETGVR